MNDVEAIQLAAKKFWINSVDYPPYPFVKERRLCELNFLIPRIRHAKSLIDIGCAEGELMLCLKKLTDIETYYGYDIAKNFLSKVDPEINTQLYDCNDPYPLPKTDVAIVGGLMMYLFEDEAVMKFLQCINSDLVFIRSTCTLKNEDEFIHTTSSPELGREYSARYLTLAHMQELLSQSFDIIETLRIYPDELESKYGTKQYYFVCKTKNR